MKLTKTKDKVKVLREFPGLLHCEFEHEIKSSRAGLNYLGPPISPQVWHKVLTFFRWTYDTTKSESQVRLYVNPQTKQWEAWAYPQEARTGMSAKELEGPAANEQRAQFKDPWVYFGTVHHHCGCSAFQSGVDRNNEEGQDGLHITVGNMDAKRHDLHCRFYLGGYEFEPDMGRFWDIGEELHQLLPSAVWDQVARHQMGDRLFVEFPAKWKENLIEIKPAPFRFERSELGMGTYMGHQNWPGNANAGGKKGRKGKAVGTFPFHLTYSDRVELAIEQVIRDGLEKKISDALIIGGVNWMGTDPMAEIIQQACEDYKIEPEALWRDFPANEPTMDAWIAEGEAPLPLQNQIGNGDKETPTAASDPFKDAWGDLGAMD